MGKVRLFKHYIHPAILYLALVEGFMLIFAFHLSTMTEIQSETAAARAELAGWFAPLPLTFAIATVLCMTAMGLYQPQMREGSGGVIRRTLGAFLAMSLVMAAIFYILPDLFQWQELFIQTVGAGLVLVLMCRYLFSKLVDRDQLQRRVLVLGAGRAANTVLHNMRRRSDRVGFKFVGFVNTSADEAIVTGEPIVTISGSLSDYATTNNIDQIVVAVDDRRAGLPIEDLLDSKLHGIQVLDVVSFFEQEAGKIMLEFVTPGWMVFSDGFQLSLLTRLGKRALDVTASFLLLMATWPVMLLTILAIWLEDGIRAPLVYRQSRVGLHGQLFDVLKFRSMRVDAEKNGKAQWATKDDDRITRVGRFIRRSRIDELPQILNVLSGDMAFIGPRPERPEFVAELSAEIPHFAARHYVKPGITGWAQLCYPYGADAKDAAQKLQFDLYYVKNHSLFLDFLILISTVEVVLFGKGAR
ncbi:TIGR03013 family PEP-CTERM/XrtA system glycosyltransferase [Halieaceae bacterium IMCC14734]|uniref:TIGR03013 family PEP-CTERM/XrtA system glycosyltransferase n=1 Tax=Candidatus Litorirhabdus singularis TaxID=2518993 RepID=A0ABT3TG27_9GAMM|nr:TIGR03013 family XrtA/PEP-CTERM system glycosyltransferase [Candidatus Litorirhabdus singularis]MCX2981266.1 TIGR03013 family PEP-CTERM/XrtA system glycosyltransferase [Candidatus Litorirhabdus singularis]